MKVLLKRAIDLALSMGADYADIRYSKFDSESISVKNGQVQGVDYHSDYGVGIRVLCGGAWGFASNPDIEDLSRMKL